MKSIININNIMKFSQLIIQNYNDEINDDEINDDEIKNVSMTFFKMHIFAKLNEKKIFFEILLTRKRKTTIKSIILTTTR